MCKYITVRFISGMNISVNFFEFKLTFFRIADDIKCMSLLILSLLNSVQLRGQPFTSGLELVGDGHEGIYLCAVHHSGVIVVQHAFIVEEPVPVNGNIL